MLFVCLNWIGMSHEVENLIQENTELLATKLVNVCCILVEVVDFSVIF